MDKNLIEGMINSETEYDISFVNKKLVLTLKYDGKGADAMVSLVVEPEFFLDKLKAAIPGKIDDYVIDMLKAAFIK